MPDLCGVGRNGRTGQSGAGSARVRPAPAHDARYPRGREDFATDVKQVATDRPAAPYFVSGTPDFITTTTRSLKDMGVVGKQIRKDPFRGYRARGPDPRHRRNSPLRMIAGRAIFPS